MLQQTDTSASMKSLELAEHAAIRVLLNSYLRECGEVDPRTAKSGTRNPLPEHGEAIVIKLPVIGKSILGTMVYFSLIGQHAYGPSLGEMQADGTQKKLDANRLIGLLLEEMSYKEIPEKREAHMNKMRARIENSLHKMRLYIEHFLNHSTSESAKKLDYLRSEQSLFLGHPFHPFPKCSEGFADTELPLYSPEMGASFQLHYMALRKEHVQEEWIDEGEEALAHSVMEYAKQRLVNEAGKYKLIPMHPWQAQYVLQQPDVEELMNLGIILNLGEMGPVVYPTSSVRTVWNPDNGYGYKLPLHIRITNLIRDNTVEQSKRTIDAARVIHHLKAELDSDTFKIILETGSSSVAFNQLLLSGPDNLSASFTVIYRPMDLQKSNTYVMASLLESFPGAEEPKLIQAIRQTNKGMLPDLSLWLECYLKISMLPLLQLLAGKGISFEAHLQNSLLSMKNGLPDCYYVRDLEGVSIDRNKAAEAGWIKTLIPDNSPVLYEESEAWMRTKYYFFVNHLGSLIHTIAAYQQADEDCCWRIVKDLLEQEKPKASKCLLAYIDDLMYSSHLPAKANFMSCFQSRGETPLFVNIPNPIHTREVEACH